MKKRVLIIDDDMDMCTLLSRFLSKNGYDTDATYSGQKGIAKFSEENFDAVLCDFRLGSMDGKEVLLSLKKIKPSAIVLIITGYSDIKTAIDVIKQGAYDYITKPLIPDEVLSILNKALEQSGQDTPQKSQSKGKEPAGKFQKQQFLVGDASATKDLYRQIEIVAPTNYSIILYGESGTGKEVIAKTIHELSSRKDKPFVAMDCGTLSKELSGSELFGHVKGAFTGALSDKEGHFELANGGTLFLDEVGNLSIDIQAALLRVIQERKFKRVGGNKEMDVDVRIIVASNENLQDAYQKGKFREDLYHRFNEFSINLPPLRNRKQDIPAFAEFFLEKTNEELEKNITGFEDDVIQMFMNYSWPGNLREFRNVVRRAVLLTQDNNMVSAKTLPWEITNTNPLTATPEPSNKEQTTTITLKKDIGLKGAASKAEYETIMNVLKEVKFNKKKAAEVLNIDRKTLYNKLKSYEEFFEQ
jgi:two-component system, NtrC family, response regulator HydG